MEITNEYIKNLFFEQIQRLTQSSKPLLHGCDLTSEDSLAGPNHAYWNNTRPPSGPCDIIEIDDLLKKIGGDK